MNTKFKTIFFANVKFQLYKQFFFTGRSVVWLARLLWEQEAESSNLSVPTIFLFSKPIMLLALF